MSVAATECAEGGPVKKVEKWRAQDAPRPAVAGLRARQGGVPVGAPPCRIRRQSIRLCALPDKTGNPVGTAAPGQRRAHQEHCYLSKYDAGAADPMGSMRFAHSPHIIGDCEQYQCIARQSRQVIACQARQRTVQQLNDSYERRRRDHEGCKQRQSLIDLECFRGRKGECERPGNQKQKTQERGNEKNRPEGSPASKVS